MIKITITSGEWRGRTRYFVGTRVVIQQPPLVLGDSVEPSQLFAGFLKHGDSWEVDYSEATEEETFTWFRSEICARMVRALTTGRPVKFLDRVWRVKAGDDPQQVAQDLEDAVVASGRLITIDSDDEKGMVIGVEGWEH